MATCEARDALESQRTLPVPPNDHPLRQRAQANLADRASIHDDLAQELLDAAVRAAASDVLLSVAEEEPVLSNMSDSRAHRCGAPTTRQASERAATLPIC